MDKCPYCGAETRPGDNFCLNCGNRLLPATPSASPQQSQPGLGDATLAAPDDWAAAAGIGNPSAGWGGDAGLTQVSAGGDPAAMRAETSAPAAQATMDRIEEPARFILRSESGEVIQEYPLDKPEITIGRAPNSDILLSKDKLTSRRHATVHYENGHYVLRDERSANGTFVNGQQIEEDNSHILQDGDHVGIGEHELIFRAFGSPSNSVEDLPTVAVPYDPAGAEMTYRTREDELATLATSDDFSTRTMNEEGDAQPAASAAAPEAAYAPPQPASAPPAPEAAPSIPAPSIPIPTSTPTSYASEPAAQAAPTPSSVPMNAGNDAGINFNRFANLRQPTLPDLTNLIAALSTLDGQITSLQEQFNATQEAMRNHESELNQITNQLRTGIRRVSERMDNTIADVARSREALAWTELMQLMEDVMANPRDIEYVTKLARKARELNKVFQIHQNVLNTMAECNSLLRSLIGEDR